jgi:hypothetical protein
MKLDFKATLFCLGPQWQWYVIFLALKKVQQVSNGFHCRSTIGWIIAALQRRQYMAASGTSHDSFFQEAFRMSIIFNNYCSVLVLSHTCRFDQEAAASRAAPFIDGTYYAAF